MLKAAAARALMKKVVTDADKQRVEQQICDGASKGHSSLTISAPTGRRWGNAGEEAWLISMAAQLRLAGYQVDHHQAKEYPGGRSMNAHLRICWGAKDG